MTTTASLVVILFCAAAIAALYIVRAGVPGRVPVEPSAEERTRFAQRCALARRVCVVLIVLLIAAMGFYSAVAK